MVSTEQNSTVDMQKNRGQSKHTSTENYQMRKEEERKKEERNYNEAVSD